MTIRVLVVARRPARPEDFGFESDDEIELVHFSNRLNSLDQLADDADVIIVDVDFPEGAAFAKIAATAARLPELRILALTTTPPRYDDVARAVGAGAAGFVDIEAEPVEFAEAVEVLNDGRTWLPGAATRNVLRDVASDIEVTTTERRSRLVAVALGLVPIAGALAALLSLLWRKYLGHIGVRPVDLAIDPTTRVVDAFAAMSMLIGVFGPLLFIRSWLDTAQSTLEERGSRWLDDRRTLASVGTGLIVLVILLVLSVYADLVLILVVGPIVAISLLASVLDLTSELPAAFRIEFARPRRAALASITVALLFLAALGGEVLLKGPEFDEQGANGILVPKFLGFSAQPAIVTDVDGALPVRERLYLGGNADLYVFVDPCNGDKIELVSVGSSRLEIIDEVTC